MILVGLVLSVFLQFQVAEMHQIGMSISPGSGGSGHCQGSGNNAPRFNEQNRLVYADARAIEERAYEASVRNFPVTGRGIQEITQSIANLKQSREMLEGQVARRNALRNSTNGAQYGEQRRRVVETATESMKLTREYVLANDYENAAIASTITNTLLDFATSFTPGVSWVRDLYESIAGIDLISGEQLGTFARSMAVFGAVTAGFGSKPLKAFGVFEKLAKTADRLSEARKFLYEKPISEIKTTVGFFKKHKIYDSTDANAVSVTNAFLKNAEKEILTEDKVVVRYYPKVASDWRGGWVTTKEVADPHMELALFHNLELEKRVTTIPKGTEVLKGFAAPQHTAHGYRPGGAPQILVDKNLLQ